MFKNACDDTAFVIIFTPFVLFVIVFCLTHLTAPNGETAPTPMQNEKRIIQINCWTKRNRGQKRIDYIRMGSGSYINKVLPFFFSDDENK